MSLRPPAVVMHYVQHFSQTWMQFIRAIDIIPEPEERRRQQLLSSLLLLLVLVSVPILTLLFLLAQHNFMLQLIGTIIITGAYGLSRTRYYRQAALLTISVLLVEPLVGVGINASQIDYLTFIALGILLSSLILSDVETLIISALGISGVIALTFFDPEVELQHTFIIIIFLVLVAGLMAVTNGIRRSYQLHLEQRTRGLAESELRYRLIAENATDLIARYTLDGICLYVSPSCRQLLNYEPEDLVGRSIYSLMHPDDVQTVQNGSAAILKNSGISTSTYRIQRKDGAYIWFETTSRGVRAAGSGTAHEITATSRDVTGRKLIENALRESEQQFRAAAEGSLDAFCLLRAQRDENGKIMDFIFTEANQRTGQLMNSVRERLTGNRITDALGISREGIFFVKCVQVVETGISIEEESQTEDSRIQARWLQYQIVKVSDGVAITARDITERKQAEQERIELAVERERVQMLQHLISDTSHDLKTPLATLNTSVYLLKKFITDTERRDHYAGILQAQVSHLVKILDDMDSIAKLDDSKETFYFEPLELNKFLRRVSSDHEALALQKGQTLHFEAADETVIIIADETKLRRAVTNLITNAVHYTPQGGDIRVKLNKRGECAAVEVVDTGVGISEIDLPLIFERFFRAAKTRNSNGSGLGLAITKRIVEAHNGSIEVESVPNKGSTFRILMPLPETPPESD